MPRKKSDAPATPKPISDKRKADLLNWDRANTRKYGMKLHAVNDADIIAWLDSRPSKQTAMKAAFREYIANHPDEQ